MLDNFSTQRITWNKANNRVYSPIKANSGDTNGRTLEVQILNGGTVEDLTGKSVNLAWRTKDGAFNGLDVFEAVDATKGMFKIKYTTGMLSNVGELSASIVIIGTNERIESSSFVITVERSNVNDASVQSENSFTSLTTALAEVQDIDNKFNNVNAQLAQTTRQEMERENANLISIDNSNHLKHPIDSFATYRQVKDWNPADSTDKVFAPVIGKHGGILYVFWRSASDHVSNDGKIKMKKSADNGLTWETTERVVLSNTPNMYIYNMNFISTTSGLFTLVFFYRDARQKCHTAFINSINFGETWSNPLPLPKPNDVEETALCGAHTIKGGVIYQTGYTLDHRVYIIKSSNQGLNWELVGYVSQTVKMNEASITYVPKDDKFYLVARSGVMKAGVTPYGDYENFMIVGESKDAITWSTFYDIPVYGHAPWTALLSDDKLIVTYANRSRKYNDKLYSCDMVILRKGQPITNTRRFNRSDNFDSYYSGVINDGTHTHIIYYQEKTALRYHRFISGQLNLFARNEAIPTVAVNDYENSSFLQGYWKTNEKYMHSWQLEKINLDLTSYTVREFTIKQPLTVRGVFVGAMLQSSDAGKMEILDNFTCQAKFKNSTTVRVVIRNVTGSNLVVNDVDLRLFIVGE